MRMESTEGKNCNDETNHQRTNWNDETLLDETDTLLLLASQKFEAEYACNNDDAKIGERWRKIRSMTRCCCILRNNLKARVMESWNSPEKIRITKNNRES